jgi:putative ABC transport system permease protein
MNMSRFIVTVRIAWLNVLEHRRRSLLLGAAIAGVTSLFVLLASLTDGIEHTVNDTAVTLTTGHVNLNGVYKVSENQALPLMNDGPALEKLVRRVIPEAAFVLERGRGSGKLVNEGTAADVLLTGIDVKRERALRELLVVRGSLDALDEPNTILLFEKDAESLGVSVGDAVTLSAETAASVANTADVRVVAIAKDAGLLTGGSVFASLDTLRDFFQVRKDAVGVLQVHLEQRFVAETDAIAERLRDELRKAGYGVMEADARPFAAKFDGVTAETWTGQKLDVTTFHDEVSFMDWSFALLGALRTLLIGVLLATIVAGIMNSLWIATRERTREIGTLRAMGMQRGAVAFGFLLEAGFLGALGAVSGVLGGVAAIALLNALSIPLPLSVQVFLMSDRLRLVLEADTVLCAVLLMTGTACVAALYPALAAARRRPVEAMAHFG